MDESKAGGHIYVLGGQDFGWQTNVEAERRGLELVRNLVGCWMTLEANRRNYLLRIIEELFSVQEDGTTYFESGSRGIASLGLCVSLNQVIQGGG
jgi:hypothetical protein